MKLPRIHDMSISCVPATFHGNRIRYTKTDLIFNNTEGNSEQPLSREIEKNCIFITLKSQDNLKSSN